MSRSWPPNWRPTALQRAQANAVNALCRSARTHVWLSDNPRGAGASRRWDARPDYQSNIGRSEATRYFPSSPPPDLAPTDRAHVPVRPLAAPKTSQPLPPLPWLAHLSAHICRLCIQAGISLATIACSWGTGIQASSRTMAHDSSPGRHLAGGNSLGNTRQL